MSKEWPDVSALLAEARRLEGDYSDNHEVVTHMSELADALETMHDLYLQESATVSVLTGQLDDALHKEET